jgi:riboflavin biosynthesis pyrimidine reductase
VVVCASAARRAIPQRDAPLARAGISVVDVEDPCLRSVMGALATGRGGIAATHVLVEPGPTLAAAFFAEGDLVDRVWVFDSPARIDEPSSPDAPAVPAHFVKTGQVELDRDVLTEYLNPASPMFFAREGSADLVLAQAGA